MKYLNTALLLIIALALAANFYLDFKRDAAYKAKLETALSQSAPKKEDEPSPFDKQPNNPLFDSQKAPVAANTMISFDRTAHDFGRVESGPLYKTSFKFTNTGKETLYISAADASCGCTVPKWSKDPVKPGESGEITVEFDSKGRNGEQLKTVTVTTNTNPSKNVLTLHTQLYLKTN